MEDRPRLRPLEAFPVEHNGQRALALHDPSGLSAQTATLPPLAVAVIQLCDGETTRDQICEEFQRRYHQRLTRAALDGLLAQLDAALLLDSEAFRLHSAKVFSDYAKLEVRPPLHAGRSYPAAPEELRRTLDGYFAPPRGPGLPQTAGSALPRALIVPHIDFHRGGPAYAWAYRALADARELPELIVVFGTDHAGLDHPFTMTSKHFDTPLGRVDTAVELVREIARRGDELPLFVDEHHHRGEHSLEYQMVWLRYVLGERMSGIPVLPVLCGSLQPYLESKSDLEGIKDVGGFLQLLAAAVGSRRVLWIASADLAHVGPRYGDAEPLDEEDRKSLERRDAITLAPVLAGDGQGWYQAIRQEHDSRRVCGLLPIYALLQTGRPGQGHQAVYAQCPAEAGSVVSIASIVYP